MKNHITALCCALLLTLCALLPQTAEANRRLKGSGRLVDKEVVVEAPYDAVHASRAVRVQLVAGRPSDRIRIEADDNVIDKVTVRVKNRCLELSIDSDYRSLSNLHVKITVPTDGRLNKLRATSASRIIAEPTIRGKEVHLYASSAGRIEAAVEALDSELDASSSAAIRAEVKGRRCDIEASSSAAIDATLAVEEIAVELSSAAKAALRGAVLHAEADLSSASRLRADQLAAKRFDIECSSAASASICCTEALFAEASSAGSVRYAGSCKVKRCKTGSGGSVRRK